jgi:hypothetical protein
VPTSSAVSKNCVACVGMWGRKGVGLGEMVRPLALGKLGGGGWEGEERERKRKRKKKGGCDYISKLPGPK